MGTALIAVFTIGFISLIYLASDLTAVAQQRQPKSAKSPVKKSKVKHKSSKNKAHPMTLK